MATPGTGPQSAAASSPDHPSDRHESESERLDRNYGELLQELRVAQTGIQILFAGLLTLPFAQRWDTTTSFQRVVYYVVLLLTAAATVMIVGPAMYHRIVFRRGAKERLVHTASRLAIVGLAMVAAAITGVVLLVTDVLYGRGHAVLAAGLTGAVFLSIWVVLPLSSRERAGRGAGTSRPR